MKIQLPVAFLRLAMASTMLTPLAALAQETETQLTEINVKGERGDGPVDGYAASASLSATKTDTPIVRTPVAINVVTAEQMRDQAVTSVAQALRYTPGVFTEYRGSSNLHDEMYMRGFGYVPRFLDGLSFGWSSFGQLDPWLLERVEAVKGPSSVMYGQSSPGGIINMVSKRPNGITANQVGLSFGNLNRVEARFDFQGVVPENDDLAWRFVGMGFKADTQEKGLTEQRYAFSPSLRWTPNEDVELTVSAIFQNEPDAGFRNFREAEGTLYPTPQGDIIPWDFLVSDPNFDISTRNTNSIAADLRYSLGATTTLHVGARYTDITSDYRTLVWGALQPDGVTITRSASGGSDDYKQFTFDAHVQQEVQTGAAVHNIVAGLDWQTNERDYSWGYGAAPSINWQHPVYNVTSVPMTTSTDTLTESSQTGLYLQDQIDIGALLLSVGVRQDWFDSDQTNYLADGEVTSFDDSALTGRVGALYTFENGIAPYISYSTSFEPVLEVPLPGESPFDPSEGKQFEVGVKWENTDGTLFAQASYFQIEQTGVLSYDPVLNAYQQIGSVDSSGFEFEARGQITDNFSLIAAASTLDAEVTQSARPAEVGKMPARLPREMASLWGNYAFDNGLNMAAGVRYIGPSWGNLANTFEVPSATLLDLAIGYDFGAMDPQFAGLRGQINVTNLTDEQYVASCASAYACFVGSERRIIASIDYSF